MLNVRFLFSNTDIGKPCSLTTYCIEASTSTSFHKYRVLPCRAHRFTLSPSKFALFKCREAYDFIHSAFGSSFGSFSQKEQQYIYCDLEINPLYSRHNIKIVIEVFGER